MPSWNFLRGNKSPTAQAVPAEAQDPLGIMPTGADAPEPTIEGETTSNLAESIAVAATDSDTLPHVVPDAPASDQDLRASEQGEDAPSEEPGVSLSAAPAKAPRKWLRLGRKTEATPEMDSLAPSADGTDAPSLDEGIPAPAKRRWPSIGRKKAVDDEASLDTGEEDSGQKRPAKKGKPTALPIRVIIGFLPEITERDAREYALGVAEKHFEQMSLAFSDAFPYQGGFAFEAHEGGLGKAYLPEIMEHFDNQGPFRNDQDCTVVIKTATRNVQVIRTREGLTAVMLPEGADSASSEPTDWLTPRTAMAPVINTRTGFLIVGAALFTTGFLAMMVTGLLTRYQAYDPPPPAPVEYLRSEQLPSTQWKSLENVADDSYIRALRFRNGRWEPPEIVQEAPIAPVSVEDAPTLDPITGLPVEGPPAVLDPATGLPIATSPVSTTSSGASAPVSVTPAP